MEENIFPSGGWMASESEIEEERRLFYVAMTRAKKAVAFSFAQTRMRNGKHESNSPSRFVYEVDPQYIANPLTKEREAGEVKRESFSSWKKENYSSKPGYQYGQSSRPEVERRTASRPQPAQTRPQPMPVRRPQPVAPRVADANFEPTPILQLRAGQRIEHNRFGFGKILEISGNAADLKAKIAFDEHGEKILILKYAKIRVINFGQ
jgi:DNA helicase-2/ATP-dependent DNA helicase PcrA